MRVSLATCGVVKEKIAWPHVCNGERLAAGLIHLARMMSPFPNPLTSSISQRSASLSGLRVRGTKWTTM